MNILPFLKPVMEQVDKLIPDKNAAREHKESLEKGVMDAITASNLAQAEINKIEASHESIFISGWRPWCGWVCGVGMGWSFIGHPVAAWALAVWGDPSTPLPHLETDGLMNLVTAMLGFGGLRTYEKLKGVARK